MRKLSWLFIWLFNDSIFDCIAEVRDPTIYKMFAVAELIWISTARIFSGHPQCLGHEPAGSPSVPRDDFCAVNVPAATGVDEVDATKVVVL
ncbi:hypothetical protein D3Y57_00015 (plasmid) [Sphingomonas paeninsulae]|uniref:Uncharacterized protein n=1 Tax=Sphingomonas paeninsulae TaxID=2319844 RepID=A0A494T581_SPHPE|nr:hypothetical protein D3Y57_00015 [Sphingomonas paeninsulae]